MKKLILIRGLPGSGKSTIAKNNYSDYIHFETDQWMIDKNGNYLFKPKKLKEYHENCFLSVKATLEAGKKVVVSNTFIRLWEIQRYLSLLSAKEIQIIIAKGNYKNIHNVPIEVINYMCKRFEYN